MLTVLFISSRGLYPMASDVGIYDLLAESLEHQGGFTDYEVIVVDKDNPLPRPEVDLAARRASGGVRYLRPRLTPWTKIGAFAPNAARNTGLCHARGSTVVGLDDCFTMSPRYLARVAELAGVGLYTAAVLNQADASVAYAPQDLGPVPPGKYCGGLTSYPLEAAVAVNGWDERFDGGSGGDIDFSDRLRCYGVTFIRDPEVVATGYGHGGCRIAKPRCWRLAWDIARSRRALTLRGNDPWSPDELARWRTCGRDVGRCSLPPPGGVGPWGAARCDFKVRDEPAPLANIREQAEVAPWFDLGAERARNGL